MTAKPGRLALRGAWAAARGPRRTGGLLLLALAGALTCGACERARARAPRSVLLISVDSLRADRLGAYGHDRATSPNVDRLARQGVLFERAVSPTPWTLPSHVTLLSGRLPHRHGTVARVDRIDAALPLLQEVFADHGYETVGFYSGPYLDPYFGFGRGFERYVSCQSEGALAPSTHGAAQRSHDDHTNPVVLAAFTAWATRREGRPFFAFVHMWDVHFDYVPPEPYASMFDATYDGSLDGRRIAAEGFPSRASRRDVEHLLALYDGEVRYTDETIAGLLGSLDQAGSLDDTLVVVTSDHGEEFREHGGKTHHRAVYTESVHVPLILWARHGLPRGLRVRPFVSLADVAPTLLDLLGLPQMAASDGRSLIAALRGQSLPAQPVLSAMFLPGRAERRTLAIRQDDRAQIAWMKSDQWMSFDLGSDPGERHPTALTGADREPLERYDAEILAALTRRPARNAPGTASAASTSESAGSGARSGPADASGAASGELPPALRERLRSLGYLN